MKFIDKKDIIYKITLMFILISIVISYALSSTYGDIDEKKTYKFAADYDYPPYQFLDSEGNFVGFDVDIIKAVSASQKFNVEIMPMEWHNAVSSLENGDVDGIIGINESKERIEKFSFIGPTIESEQVIFVNKENVFIKGIKDLEGLTIGYQLGALGKDYIANIENSIPASYIDQESLLMALVDGEIDAAIGNKLVGIYYIQKKYLDDNIKIIEKDIVAPSHGIAIAKENIELARVLEKGLKEIKRNNSYENIYKKWIGEMQNPIYKFLYKHRMAIYTVLMFGGFLIFFLIFHNNALKKQVSKRTLELEMDNEKLSNNQREIYNLAYYDTVTSLPNRISFIKELDNKFKNKKDKIDKFAIFFLDLDKFKYINDTLGHDTGDEILKLLSLRLKNIVGDNCVVAKVGGDEYFILQDNINDEDEAIKLAEIIILDFRKPYHIGDHELYLTTSIGIATYPEAGRDTALLIKNSDLALYKAKEFGGNSYYVYGDEIKSKGLDRMMLLNELRHGIENDELILYYQPQIDIKENKLIGFEALVRWKHPDRGIIPPNEFISLAEETGLIIPMGRLILKKATLQAQQWIKGGHNVVISVNISARQFQDKEFLEDLQLTLNEVGLDPKFLTIEITETIAISDMKYTLSILEKLNGMGIAVSMDDFGTGYSSLSYLNDMNVNELKIDRSFIFDIDINHKNKTISHAIILLAKQLGLRVTAEGVETKEQLEILSEMKCDIAQGYYFSKPVPADQICNIFKREWKFKDGKPMEGIKCENL